MENLTQAIRGNELLQILRIRSFFLLMVSEFFSQIAFNMQHFVFIFVIYHIAHSNTAVSGLILSFTIPAIIFSISAGVYVDRWRKRSVLFTTNFLRGLLLLLFLIPHLHLAVIYTITFFIAVATQFFLPAESAIIPLLVKPQQIISANAIYAIGIYSTVLIGYVGSGPLLLWLGPNTVFIILALLFFISAFCILFVPIPEKKKKEDTVPMHALRDSFTKDIKEIFQYIRKAQVVSKALVILTVSQAIIFTFAVLGPGYVATILNVQVEQLSVVLLAPAAVGMIVGSLIVGNWGKRIRGRTIIGAGFILTGLMFLFLPLGSRVASQGITQTINAFLPRSFDITSLHIIILLSFIAGIANAFIFVPANATIQRYTSEDIRGRIYGFLNALVGAVSLLPVVVAGGLADILGVGTVIVIIGIIMICLGSFALGFSSD